MPQFIPPPSHLLPKTNAVSDEGFIQVSPPIKRAIYFPFSSGHFRSGSKTQSFSAVDSTVRSWRLTISSPTLILTDPPVLVWMQCPPARSIRLFTYSVLRILSDGYQHAGFKWVYDISIRPFTLMPFTAASPPTKRLLLTIHITCANTTPRSSMVRLWKCHRPIAACTATHL